MFMSRRMWLNSFIQLLAVRDDLLLQQEEQEPGLPADPVLLCIRDLNIYIYIEKPLATPGSAKSIYEEGNFMGQL